MSTNNDNGIAFHSEESRKQAMKKFEMIRPILMEQARLSETAKETGVPIRTLQSWIQKYSKFGLKGLIRKKRSDINSYRINQNVLEEIERLALSFRSASITSIHRKVCKYCNSLNLTSPSYKQVYYVIRNMPPSLKTLAFEGKKEYQNQFDLIYSREANYPNQIWQADHTLLDIIVLNEKGKPERPWLTIIMDDYSRAITGFSLSFQAPSAIQTALTLHHAIWKKENKNWPVCGIPENFYTDHGSDFTSTHLEQVAVDLKINLLFSTIGVPRGRGKIERFFLSINQLFLQDLPGYTKKNQQINLSLLKN